MSRHSVMALSRGRSYLQSPVDDIESFLWVSLYGIVRNSTSPRSDLDNELQDIFDKQGRDTTLPIFHDIRAKKGYCELIRTLSASALLSAYDVVNHELRAQWEDDIEVLDDSCDDRAWELCCHAAAIRGLLGVLRILVDFKAKHNKTAE